MDDALMFEVDLLPGIYSLAQLYFVFSSKALALVTDLDEAVNHNNRFVSLGKDECLY